MAGPKGEPEVIEEHVDIAEPVEEAPVAEEVFEEVNEPQPEEEPVITEVASEVVEPEVAAEEEVVDDSFEEPAVEVKETVRDIIPPANPFPHLAEKKINSIREKVKVMLNVVGECREVELLHYIVFPNKSDFDAYRTIAFGLGYEVDDDINDNGEVYLSNTVVADKEKLDNSILTLADTVSAYRGSYKGWKVKDVIE
ncbi:MAG: hypothetical protein E7186_07980 [Erysipelotrichaceae bacterium]|nr:hypothetical protein [Erysipelotrichaceae bacterium]